MFLFYHLEDSFLCLFAMLPMVFALLVWFLMRIASIMVACFCCSFRCPMFMFIILWGWLWDIFVVYMTMGDISSQHNDSGQKLALVDVWGGDGGGVGQPFLYIFFCLFLHIDDQSCIIGRKRMMCQAWGT